VLGEARGRRDPNLLRLLRAECVGEDRQRIDLLPVERPGVERLKVPDREGQVRREPGVLILEEVCREQVGHLAEELRITRELGIILEQRGQLVCGPPRSARRAKCLDIRHGVALSSRKFPEEEPDQNHNEHHDRRNHEQLHNEPG
jgi:hypothetical protein